MGLKGQEAATRIVELLDLPISAQEYYDLAKQEYATIMQDAQLMTGNQFSFFQTQNIFIKLL